MIIPPELTHELTQKKAPKGELRQFSPSGAVELTHHTRPEGGIDALIDAELTRSVRIRNGISE